MAIRIGKTLAPAAAPLRLRDFFRGIEGLSRGEQAVARFEQKLSSFYRARYCFAVSSGKAALCLILQALKSLSPERDEVLVPAYACYSVPSAIARSGLKMRLCDLAFGTLDYDFGLLKRELENPRLLCIVSIHQFGVPADVERVKKLCAGHGVFVVEDAAQAMGGEVGGRKLGTLGDVGLFSLGRGKTFSTVEGGVILTDNASIGAALMEKIAGIGGYGTLECLKLMLQALALCLLIHPCLYWLPKALPFLKLGETIFDPSFPIRRLSPFQAGIAAAWRMRMEQFRRARGRNSSELIKRNIYDCSNHKAPLIGLIKFPVLMPDKGGRLKLLQESESAGLGISPAYPDTLYTMGGTDAGSGCLGYPVARDLVDRLVSLPVHPLVQPQDLDAIARLLKKHGGVDQEWCPIFPHRQARSPLYCVSATPAPEPRHVSDRHVRQ